MLLTSTTSPETESNQQIAMVQPQLAAARSTEFFFEDGNVIILVEDTLYSIPRHFLRGSDLFRTMLSLDPGPDETVEGLTLGKPLNLSKADSSLHKADFEPFLRVLTSPIHRPLEFTVDELRSILHLAHKWQFTDIERYAIDLLDDETLSACQRIELGAKYNLDEFLLQGYIVVCSRPAPIDILVYNALVPHLGAEKYFDLVRARREVWKHLRRIPAQHPNDRFWRGCLSKPTHCHTNEKFRRVLNLIFEDEREEIEEGATARTFEDAFVNLMSEEGHQCSYCLSCLRERIRWFIKAEEITGIIKCIMMPPSLNKVATIMRQILEADDDSKVTESMTWPKFLMGMQGMGFTIDLTTAGSSVRFDPPNSQDRSISFHEPHPDPTIPPVMLKQFSARLKRHYGWMDENFKPWNDSSAA